MAQLSAGWCSPEASLSARPSLRLPDAPASPDQPAARAALTGHIGLVFDRAQHIHDTVETHMSASGSGLRLPRVPLREAWMITGVEEK